MSSSIGYAERVHFPADEVCHGVDELRQHLLLGTCLTYTYTMYIVQLLYAMGDQRENRKLFEMFELSLYSVVCCSATRDDGWFIEANIFRS